MTHSQFPTNSAAVTTGALVATWIPTLDTWLRIGASLVAIISGAIVAYIAIQNYRKGKG